jgi:uncharacterized protein (DUF2235 family)
VPLIPTAQHHFLIVTIGLLENIQEAYGFICHNYDTPEDEIHLIGFSRGAFTVRSIAQLMQDIGLLTKRGLRHLRPLYKLWMEGHKDRLRQEIAKITATGNSRLDIRVTTCAVWDTVGSFGLPMIGFIPQPAPRKLKFVNSRLCPNIDNAIQALSLHEHRRHFQAIVWKKPEEEGRTLKQCWFLGFHSDIGGGNKEEALAHLAMVWIMDQMQRHLDLKIENLWDESCPAPTFDNFKFSWEKAEERSWSVGIDLSVLFRASISVGYQRVLTGLNRELLRFHHLSGHS